MVILTAGDLNSWCCPCLPIVLIVYHVPDILRAHTSVKYYTHTNKWLKYICTYVVAGSIITEEWFLSHTVCCINFTCKLEISMALSKKLIVF